MMRCLSRVLPPQPVRIYQRAIRILEQSSGWETQNNRGRRPVGGRICERVTLYHVRLDFHLTRPLPMVKRG
jgi:hypothetical protein